jgi:two-component system nitrate/nitrite response regulator NarL
LPEHVGRADKLDLRLARRESGKPTGQPTVRDPYVSVVVADDHPLLRAGIRRVLDAEDGFVVLGEAGNGAEAVELVERLQPDVLLLDLDMPGSSGLDALRSLGANARRVRVILLTSELERQGIIKGLQLGARGVIFKDADPSLLVKAIHRVLTGQYWVGREMVGDLVGLLCELLDPGSVSPRPLAFGLTTRELDVVEKVVSGATNKQIAKALRMSEETVKHHLTSVFAKVGVSTRLELALFAVHHRLVTPQSMGSENPTTETQRPPAVSR